MTSLSEIPLDSCMRKWRTLFLLQLPMVNNNNQLEWSSDRFWHGKNSFPK